MRNIIKQNISTLGKFSLEYYSWYVD